MTKADVRGGTRSDVAHVSTTDPDPRHFENLAGTHAVPCFIVEEDRSTPPRATFPMTVPIESLTGGVLRTN